MNLEAISPKQLNELEHSLQELLTNLRKVHLQNEPLAKSLQEFEHELAQVRRRRFDAANPEYRSY